MSSADTFNAADSWINIRLLVFVLLLLMAFPALADNCSDPPYNGVIDGNVLAAPSQIQIDTNCTVRNFPASDPLTTNFSFLSQPGQTDERWLVVFDNVVHIGNMACDAVHEHKIWFTNGSSSSIQEGCQNLLIPVEKINKQNPAGQTTAAVNMPFTYTLTMPVLFDPATGTVINSSGSLNDLHGVTVIDDLNATGADLTYISHVAYWQDSGAPVPHTFSNAGGVLTFDNFPIIPAGQQIVVELTVVLDDTPANVSGTQFINTAKWDFGRLIDGVFFEPLPGEWGITPPMTIAAPELVVTKIGPATLGRTLNLGEWGEFAIDVLNIGLDDAWEVTILDRLPDGPTGGMCNLTPQVLGARVFAADGTTPIPGKAALVPGTDFSLSYTAAPTCELRLTTLTAAGAIGPNERLIIAYRTQLDADSQDGTALTNVAGAVQWFNADRSITDRQSYSRTLTDGTVGVLDHEDAHTVTVALAGYFFEKSVANLTSGVSPAATANPGDRLRYTLRLQSTDIPLDDLTFRDDLGALNGSAVFVPGTLALVAGTIPPGADTANTNPAGGTNGAGILDIRNLSVPAFGEVQIQFDITLDPTLSDGTVVTNQADLIGAAKLADSDDPNINGQADPNVAGDEDPTQIRIDASPLFDVDKISSYVTGDPDVLMAGETLRYTITVRNIGTGDAVDAMLVDQIPANTSYVPGSTMLNGIPVPDASGGASPLGGGIAIHAPEDPTPGTLHAVAAGSQNNVATIVFDVVVNPDVIDGTVISNQAFVSAIDGGVIDQPSDDPRTPTADDPTRDIVGSLPLLFAEKSVDLQIDLASPNIVDPGDVLRYTIAIHNNGAISATAVDLTDTVPANTTYVADSMTLNGLPVGQPDGGVFPLAAGISVSSADLTPPLPGAGEGALTAGETATVQFDLRVNDGVPDGTVISNQAVVESEELPDLLTDGDGNPATGPEPTVVVVGASQQLSITKQVSVVGGGAAVAGATIEYVVRARNIAAVPAFDVVVTDDLDVPIAGHLSYVDQSATMNGLAAGVSAAGSVLVANYSALNGPLEPGESVVLRFRAIIDPALAIGTTVTNTALVSWNAPQQTASASVSIDVGGVPGSGTLSGTVWHDADFDRAPGGSERLLEGWTVELRRNDQHVHSTLTGVDGAYRMIGLPSTGLGGDPYELRFRAPGAGPASALLGTAESDFTNSLQRIGDIVVAAGGNLQNLNLPIDPNGVVYDSVLRLPVAGATITMARADSGTALPSSCFDDPGQQNQVTLADGYYKFDINFSGPACGSGGNYVVLVTPPTTGYIAGVSEMIPPASDISTAPFDVPACPGSANDAIAATDRHCEVQTSEFAPAAAVPARSAGTDYHVHLTLNDGQTPGSSQLFNNHIPLDSELDGAVFITKTTPLRNVTRGQMIPYVITLNNVLGVDLHDVGVVDRFPAGFRYVEGSARLDGVATEPVVNGRELVWSHLSVGGSARHTVQLLLAVGAGVSEGEFVNRAQVVNTLTGNALSGEASATVRLVPDPTFDCTDVTGKVFDDVNRNGYQDGDEAGLPGVRLVTARGLAATTDGYGRFHITCAVTPHESRGSNFVLKLDDRTLPSGYRSSGQPVQVKRATRGKSLRFNFGASIHRVVGLDIADAVFVPGQTEMREQWKPRIDLLLKELQKAPAVLRLSYVADVEEKQLVDRRLNAIRKQITDAWEALDCCYELVIEPEVYWRLGAPPEAPKERRRTSG